MILNAESTNNFLRETKFFSRLKFNEGGPPLLNFASVTSSPMHDSITFDYITLTIIVSQHFIINDAKDVHGRILPIFEYLRSVT